MRDRLRQIAISVAIAIALWSLSQTSQNGRYQAIVLPQTLLLLIVDTRTGHADLESMQPQILAISKGTPRVSQREWQHLLDDARRQAPRESRWIGST